jgi:hypothetical protein
MKRDVSVKEISVDHWLLKNDREDLGYERNTDD